MSAIKEIEAAIAALPEQQMDELARWLEAFRQRRSSAAPVEAWLDRARGAATQGATTDGIMALTRGDE